MNTRLTLLILFFSVHTSHFFSQHKKLDSLETIWKSKNLNDSIKFQALDTYYETINEVEPDETLAMLDAHYSLAIKEKNNLQLFLAAKWIGNINRFKGNLKVSLKSYKEADSIARILEDTNLQATIKGNMGNVFANQRDYSKATQYFSEALKIYQQENDIDGTAHMLTSLGTIHLIIENYSVSQNYYEKALEQLSNIENENRNFAIIKSNIGWSNYKRGLFEEALINYEEALVLFTEQNRKFLIASCYATLSLIHKELGYIEKAKNYARKDYNLNKELNRETPAYNAELNMATIIFETNINEATSKGEDLLSRMPNNADIEIKSKLYNLLYKCYKAKNMHLKSLRMHELYATYEDSLQIVKNNYAVARETVQKDFELQLYENKLESEKAQTRLEIVQIKKTYSIIGVSLLIIAIITFIFGRKQLKNKRKREKLLKEIFVLKNESKPSILADSVSFELNRDKIEASIARKLNDTDWKVLNILLDDPVISNKKIAEKAFKSVDGIGSSLRRMYDYFEIQDTKYKKIALLTNSINRSKTA